ncbi:MAG: transketolase C-terminal domain-containing protein [Eubacteriales bacterium]|nr:transketolase C-terminal domain-containing protein [Eubacteriales bacterium]
MADLTANVFLRNEIGNEMIELGQKDPRVVVVNADLMGTCRNGSFVEKFPSRSFNVGIAEQNLVSFSAGLAHEGFMPFAFSMSPFLTMRACEQCRTDIAYGQVDARLIGTYAGCSGGISGATHWSVEDCAIMTSIPGMTVLEPCDAGQVRKMLHAALAYHGPIFIRSTIEPVCAVYTEDTPYEIGKAAVPLNGTDGAFICSGITVKYALIAAVRIREKTGKQIRVVDMHTLKPIDRHAVVEAARTGHIVVAQDHNIVGGLGYAVSAVLAEEGLSVKFVNLGFPDHFVPMAHASYLYRQFGYDDVGLETKMLELLSNEPVRDTLERI